MNVELVKNTPQFELVFFDVNGKRTFFSIEKKRSLIGRGQACDIVLNIGDVSSIHAVLENDGVGNFKIYDLNSKNGVRVNGQNIVAESISLDQDIFLGDNKIQVRKYKKEDLPVPPLDVLDETKAVLPPVLGPSGKKNELPQSLPTEQPYPRIEYPLAKDPKAEFSEYIFEDAENLYPIFKYKKDKTAVEVIIVFNDRIQSVDYLPDRNGSYNLVGANPSGHDIEYPYLGKKEKFSLINISNGAVEVRTPIGYEAKNIGGEDEKVQKGNFFLAEDEIIQFTNQHIQIYVRSTEVPPSVAAAPVFRRDKELLKYVLLMLFLVTTFLGFTYSFNVDEEVEKDKAPERIATILYKKELTVSKSKVPDKTKKAPKKVAQKSPKNVMSKQKPKDVVKEKPKEVVKNSSAKKAAGNPNTTKVGKVKKASPNKAKVTVKKNTVKPRTSAKVGGSSRRLKSAKASPNPGPSKGAVDTYKSADFASSISSLMSKGGATKSAKAVAASSSGIGTTAISGSDTGATLKTAKVSNNTGALSGVATGTLDSAKGVEGLVDKKDIYTAGLPYKTVILGGLDPDVIRQILVENIPSFRYCYQKVLDKSRSAFNGIVNMNFIIGASGHVTKAGIESQQGIPGSVKSCVANVLRRIRFPEPRGGGVTEVSQPMNFYPRVN